MTDARSAIGLRVRRQGRLRERFRCCARLHNRAINGGKNGAGVIEEHAPRREQGHASRCALEELRADLVFERANLPTHGRLRDVKAQGGAPDVALLGNGNEVANLRKAHVIDGAGCRQPDQDEAT